MIDCFSLILGVSLVDVFGGLYKVMYVKFKFELMVGCGVMIFDILSVLCSENIESFGGEVCNDLMVMLVRIVCFYKIV